MIHPREDFKVRMGELYISMQQREKGIMSLAFDLQKDNKERENNPLQPYKLVSLLKVLGYPASGFVAVFMQLGQFVAMFEMAEQSGLKTAFPVCRFQLGRLHEELSQMELTSSATATERLLELIDSQAKISAAESREKVNELVRRIMDDLDNIVVQMIPKSDVDYFNASEKVFPEKIRDNFPSAEYELEEAGKCFALDRHTACVFHAMRALEPGLKALGANLGIGVETNWNAALDQIEKEIRSRNRGNQGPTWMNDEPFYTEAATHFRFVKNAWRNYTMHLKEHYDKERASKILTNVCDFLSEIAARLHE